MATTLVERLSDVIAVPILPLTADDRIDPVGLGAVLTRMGDAGIRAFTPNGNTGEFFSLSDAELQAVVEITIATVASPRTTVIAGVGHDPARAKRLARMAETCGADAIMVHQPVTPYRSARGWVDYHRAIADAVSETPIVVYVRDPRIGIDEICQLAEVAPNFRAVKYSVADPLAMDAARHAVGEERLVWICGLAERWAPFFWFAGAQGFTSGLANVHPALSRALLDGLRSGNDHAARAAWRLALPMERLRARDGDAHNVSALKEAAWQLGLIGRDVRSPSSVLDDDDREIVARILAGWSLGA